MKTDAYKRIFLATIVASSLPACGGAVGEAIRPTDHNATSALTTGAEAKTCAGDAKYAKPLIVDLDPDTRVDLEAAMKKGLVVVNYDCANLRVLAGCKLPDAAYEYAGVSRKEQVVQIKNADDLSVNLPLSSAKLSGELTSGRTIDLALVLVGRRSTTVGKVDRDDLVGACEGATHYLQNATLGAFSMQTGSVGKVAAVAEMFNRGGSAQSASERKAMNSDGSLDDCRTSNPDAESPPTECRAPLRVELVPIVAKIETQTKKLTEKEKEAEKKTATAVENPCPRGYAFTDGICTKAESAAHICDAKNEVECSEQCDKGSPESCYNYARLLSRKNPRSAALPYFKKACDADVADGCGALAWQMSDPDTDNKDRAKVNVEAVKLAQKACAGGSAMGCEYLGDILTDKDYAVLDEAAGVKAYDRGCSLGNGSACWSLSQLYLRGQGVAKDPKMAISLLVKACQGGSADECFSLARTLDRGVESAVPADPNGAFRAAKRACEIDVEWCESAVTFATAVGNGEDALSFAQRACDANDEDGCTALGNFYDAGTGTAKDAAKAQAAWTKGCNNGEGSRDACKRIGVKMKN